MAYILFRLIWFSFAPQVLPDLGLSMYLINSPHFNNWQPPLFDIHGIVKGRTVNVFPQTHSSFSKIKNHNWDFPRLFVVPFTTLWYSCHIWIRHLPVYNYNLNLFLLVYKISLLYWLTPNELAPSLNFLWNNNFFWNFIKLALGWNFGLQTRSK